MLSEKKLLGSLPFVSRTFEGSFKESPFVLDMDANLYIGPADQASRDEHGAIEVVFHFLLETKKIERPLRDLLRDRRRLLDAFAAFDEARSGEGADEFRIHIHGTYDGVLLDPVTDDDLPAGPCGLSVNTLKERFYALATRLDPQFETRELDAVQRAAESRLNR